MAGLGGRAGGYAAPGQRLEPGQQSRLVGLDGEDVVRAGGEDRVGGIGLGVHGVQGDHASAQVSRVEPGQQVTHCGDLVALRGDRDLPEDDTAGVVEGGDQVRRQVTAAPAGACPADRLTVDRDHPAALHVPAPGPAEHAELPIQRRRVEAGEQLTQRRLLRSGGQPQPGEGVGAQLAGPLTDRGEGPRTGQHAGHRNAQQTGQPVPDTAWVTRIGDPAQQPQQLFGAVVRVHGRRRYR